MLGPRDVDKTGAEANRQVTETIRSFSRSARLARAVWHKMTQNF